MPRRGAAHGSGRLSVDVDRDDRDANVHDLPLLRMQRRDDPGARRGDLDARLVGHDLDQRLILTHSLAGLHQPAHDLALGDAFADVGQLHLVGHRVGSSVVFHRYAPTPTDEAGCRGVPTVAVQWLTAAGTRSACTWCHEPVQ